VNLLNGRRARDDQLSRTFTRNDNVIQFAGIKKHIGFYPAPYMAHLQARADGVSADTILSGCGVCAFCIMAPSEE
jgi:hypothetical protein